MNNERAVEDVELIIWIKAHKRVICGVDAIAVRIDCKRVLLELTDEPGWCFVNVILRLGRVVVARGVGAVVAEVIELVDVEAVCAGVGVGIDTVSKVLARLAVIGGEVSDACGDLSIASVRAARRL